MVQIVRESLNESTGGRMSIKKFEDEILRPLAAKLGVQVYPGKTDKKEDYAKKMVSKFFGVGNVTVMVRDYKVAGMRADDVDAWILDPKDKTTGTRYSAGWGSYKDFCEAVEKALSPDSPAGGIPKGKVWTKEKVNKLVKELRAGAAENGEVFDAGAAYDIADGVFASEKGLKEFITKELHIQDPMGWLADQIA